MKQLMIALLSIVAIIYSCKKEKTDVPLPLGTLRATIDGVITDFNVEAKASVPSFQNGSGIMISGYKKYGSTTEFVIIIKHTAPVTTGTYVENSVGDPLVTMTYFYDVFLGAGTQYSSFHSTSRPAMVIISEMSASSIRGAFEGELHGHDSSGEAKNLQVTNGVFYVSFKP